TNRGFAVFDLDYSGSTGYGRDYRRRLDGQWGVRDAADAVAAARHLIAPGQGARGKVFLYGSGAGGVQPVAAATARVADINIVQTALGTATALRTVTVKPRVDGQLKAILFTEGQIVKAGDPIAQIDPVPFQVALSQQEGNLARDAAQLNNARLDLQRYQTLLEQDSIAKQQVDQQAALVKQLEGTVKVDQAQVDNAKLQLSYTHIEAPIAGRLGLTQVDPGNMVKGSDANGVAVITQVDPMGVLFTIPQDTLPRVLARLRAGDKPPVEAWDKEQKVLLAKGLLLTTDNQIDVTTGTVKLKAQFSNPSFQLFPNQFVNVRMVIDTLKGVVVVPTAAIQRGNQGTIVYVVKEDSTVSLRQITAGPTEGQLTAVTTGLQAGERVITDGVDRIREGAKVEVTEPGAGLRQGAPGKTGDPAKREEYRKRLESAPPEQREEMKKRLENMTPEQREESRKRREARGAGEGSAKQ
ncbi:MAG: MdtA/MuxA family multidrug efflux RND transporter periplasmic adaptor subunit, partial [Burkholderiales bacterium]|nr:MdtA/MuxA family multidrug efflux RND transporter periplasmic adaptor subunit [Burkholderiales bacterium]